MRRILAAVLLGAVVVTAAGCTADAADPGEGDALAQRTLDDLQGYLDWLAEHEVAGYIGEYGWPGRSEDSAAWTALADRWADAVADAGVPAAMWGAGSWWDEPGGPQYPLAVYSGDAHRTRLAVAHGQAAVLEAHQAEPLDGVNLNGLEFGTHDGTGFSNAEPGTPGVDWYAEPAASLDFLADRGIRSIRLPVRWERLQSTPFGELDEAVLQTIDHLVADAADRGIGVVLDVHNFGGYAFTSGTEQLGSPGLPVDALADLWRRLSERLRDTGVVAYDLMNEPHDLPGGVADWQRASQAAVDAIRAAGDTTEIIVEGYDWAHAADWAATNGAPWIDDPADAVRYSAHHYWDADRSGGYAVGYAAEVAAAG